MNFIIGFFILGQALICLSQSDEDGGVELPCGLDKETLDKAKGALHLGTISLPILRCLCKLKVKTSASGSAGGSMGVGGANVDASASVNVGIDLNNVTCDGVANPDPSKKIEYTIQIGRIHLNNNTQPGDINSYIFIPDIENYYGNYTSTVVKKMEKDDCLYIKTGKMGYGSAKYLINVEKDHSIEQICDEFDEGTDEYNFLKILKYVLVGGNDCPIEKGTEGSINKEYPPMKISTNEPWPCDTLDMKIDLRDKPDTKNWGILGRWNWYVEGIVTFQVLLLKVIIMNFIIGLFILGQALICLSQSDEDGSVELPCGLDQKTLDKANGALHLGTINLPILRCLCKLKVKTSASGSAGGSMGVGGANVDASASVNVGIDLNNVTCDGVANPDPSKKIEYTIQIRRIYLDNNTRPGEINSYIFIDDIEMFNGNYTSTVVKKMEKDDCLYIKTGYLGYGSAKYLINVKKDHSIEQICDEFDEDTDEYNFLKILKYVLLGGNDCPIEKDTTGNINKKYPPMKISTKEPWPCGTLNIEVDLRDKPDIKSWGILGKWDWLVEGDCVDKPKN
ncbi:hypothetical protein HCN44_003304 [Aphidius gifuensis]|uniref:Odorant-binding protein n=1 Tax=Aphidius gifuensis TaxID=684658 RepID=A0A835CKT4_APHGI|nr:hypothetical protein HCN44_003304 [Aphidius gifuensis]